MSGLKGNKIPDTPTNVLVRFIITVSGGIMMFVIFTVWADEDYMSTALILAFIGTVIVLFLYVFIEDRRWQRTLNGA